LLGDFRVPVVCLAAEARAPVQPPIVELLDLVDSFHEARELLELRPLVVDRRDRGMHLDRLLDRRHPVVSLGRFARYCPAGARSKLPAAAVRLRPTVQVTVDTVLHVLVAPTGIVVGVSRRRGRGSAKSNASSERPPLRRPPTDPVAAPAAGGTPAALHPPALSLALAGR
jgi:hypothetical protein